MTALMPFRRMRNLPTLFPHEMDELFEKFFGFGEVVPGVDKFWAPRVDVIEKEKEILVKADLPGVDPKEVEIFVANSALILKGMKKEEKEEKGINFVRNERFVGTFYREVPLPIGVDPEKIVATSSKGVLIVTIPKKPEVLPKKVPIKAIE